MSAIQKLVQSQSKANPKPGVYTSEFWLMVLALVVSLLSQHNVTHIIPAADAGSLEKIAIAAYLGARGLAKAGGGSVS